jgi:hypothetical protein
MVCPGKMGEVGGVAEVEDFRAGDRGERGGGGVEGGVVRGRERTKKRDGVGAELVAEHAERVLEDVVRVLEIERQRIDHEEAVLGEPGFGVGAEEEILEGFLGEGGEAGVGSGGVGVEEGAVGGGELSEDGLGERAEAVRARAAVERERDFAEEFGEFAGGAAAQEIHLKKTILGVEKAEGAGDVGARGAADRGDAEGVARGGDGSGEAGERARAVELREAGAELKIKPCAGAGGDEYEHAEYAGEKAETFGGGFGHGTGESGWSDLINRVTRDGSNIGACLQAIPVAKIEHRLQAGSYIGCKTFTSS